MRTTHRLTAKSLSNLSTGKYADGGGLWLIKRPDGGAQWVLRYTIHGRRREMGLGGYPAVTLVEARRAAEAARIEVRAGGDPVRLRQAARREAARDLRLLKDVAADAFESRKAELRGDGLAGRWWSPVEHHILPRLGNVPVAEINQADIRDALKPIWHEKGPTAAKALNRLAIILKHAAALGLTVDLQAPEKARALLGRTRYQPAHVEAMPWRDVPAFYRSLDDGSLTTLALRLIVLTGARSRPLRFLHVDHIEGDLWVIPAFLMKGRLDATAAFRVPLSKPALQIVKFCAERAVDGYLFPGQRKGAVINDSSMISHMRREGMAYRPHGFRSSLRDWIAETTDAPHEVAEMCLAHRADSAVVRSYRRSDFIDQRRALMQAWADHVTGAVRNSAKAENPPTAAAAA